jgi:predicted protein tyrosine phosphatase
MSLVAILNAQQQQNQQTASTYHIHTTLDCANALYSDRLANNTSTQQCDSSDCSRMQLNLNMSSSPATATLNFQLPPLPSTPKDNNATNSSIFNFQSSSTTQPPTSFSFNFNSKAASLNPKTPDTSPTNQPATTFLKPAPKKKNVRKRPVPLALAIPKEINSLSNVDQMDFTPPPKISTTTPPNTATEITKKILLGSEQDAKCSHLYRDGTITQVLSIMSCDQFQLPPEVRSKVKHLHIKLNDTSGDDILQHFQKAIAFISANKTGSTLIHCRAGISRSSTIVMAFLMYNNKWSLNQAFTFVKDKRKCVAPNFGFLGQLQKFEEELGTSSPTSANSPN